MKTPTYAEIAVACKVSSSTVSRALNNHRSIPKSTRQRILKVAKGMGWQPNPLAGVYMSHLRSTRPPSFKAVLGVVIDYPMPNGWEGVLPYYQLVFRGVERRAGEYGYKVQVFNLQDPDMTPALLDRALFNRNIYGIVVTGLRKPGRVLHGMNWSRYASVAVGYSMDKPALHRVSANMALGVKLLIDQGLKLGYRRIGVMTTRTYDQRVNHGVLFPAHYAAHHVGPGQSVETFVSELPGESQTPVAEVADWLKRYKPDYVIGTSVLPAIESLGLRVPGDIAVATFDRSPEYPDHAGLDQRYESLGQLAADVLIGELTQNRRGIPGTPVEHLINGRWVDGKTAPGRK